VPIPEDPKVNGWLDVYLTLPAKYATGDKTVFRIGCPKGSAAASVTRGTTRRVRPHLGPRQHREPRRSRDEDPQRVGREARAAQRGLRHDQRRRIAFQGFACPYASRARARWAR